MYTIWKVRKVNINLALKFAKTIKHMKGLVKEYGNSVTSDSTRQKF
jgi:hypothetical protein